MERHDFKNAKFFAAKNDLVDTLVDTFGRDAILYEKSA